MISRIKVLLGSVFLLAVALANPASGFLHRGSSSSQNNNRVTINATGNYINLAKGAPFPATDPTLLSSDGYYLTTPPASPSSNLSAALPLPAGYFDQYTWKWSGSAAMSIPGQTAIIYSGGTFSGLGAASGQVTGNFFVAGLNPRVVFKLGALVASVSGGSGSLVTITTSSNLNFGSGLNTGLQVKLGIGVSSNLSNGPNSDGSWTITNVDGTHFTLNNSTGVVSPTVTSTGVVGTNSEAVVGDFSVNWSIASSGTFSGWAGLVFCRAADEAAVDSGAIWDPTYVSQLKALFNNATASVSSYGYLRFMDLLAVQGSFESDFSQRIPATYISYPPSNFRSGYWVSGGVTNAGSDNYTAADPSVSTWSGTAYVDNAIVQGTIIGATASLKPTLAVGGHPAKPIIQIDSNPYNILFSSGATSPGTDVLQFTFTASWLNGGSPYVFSYATVSGDNNLKTLVANLTAALVADNSLKNALVFFTNSVDAGTIGVAPRTAQAGRLTFSYSSGPAICSVGTILSTIANGSNVTFIYSYLLDAWFYLPGAMATSVPLEAIVALCNQVGAHLWSNWGITKSAYIIAVTQFYADPITGLSSGLKLGNEMANEIWNPGANPYAIYQVLGKSLGWSEAGQNSIFSYAALRTKQYQSLALTAWTGKGRSASDFYTLNMAQVGDETIGGPFSLYQLNGASLTTSNSLYNLYSGLNGTGAVASYNVAPNRPVDGTTAIGQAPYWGSPWFAGTAASISGPVSENIPWLQGSKDFSNGLTAVAFASLVNQFNGTTTRASGSAGAITLPDYANIHFPGQETLAASYTGRSTPLGILWYEGGPQFAVGNNLNNGVNSVNSIDVASLAARIGVGGTVNGVLYTGLNWDVSPYTISGTNNPTELATQVITMLQAWKYDPSYDSLISTSLYQPFKAASGSNREAKPGQYGYNRSQWGFFPDSIFSGNQYQNYSTVSKWNAGN